MGRHAGAGGYVTRACHAPVHLASKGAFSDAEIDAILDRVARRRQRLGGKGLPDREAYAQAAQELTREELLALLTQRRLEAAAEAAKMTRRARLDAMPKALDEADRLRAYNVGSEKQGLYTSASADAEARALTVSLWGEVELGLRAAGDNLMDRLANFFGVGDDVFDRQVAREMARLNGAEIDATHEADAVKVAKVLVAAQEKGRAMQNAAGAWIEKLEGYIARQSHDALKVAGGFWREVEFLTRTRGDVGAARLEASRKAFRAWRDFIWPRLDPRTFEGIDPADLELAADAKALQAAGVIDGASLEERFLYRVWSDIVSGAHEVISGASDVGEFRPPAGKARAVSKSRVLHFASPDAWMDYHARYGHGSLLGVIMGDLERAAKNTALMRRWGPNPQTAYDNEVARLMEEARARGDVAAMKRLQSHMRAAEFGQLTGEANRPESLRFAKIGAAIRLDQQLSKLGAMVWSAIGSDQALAGQAFQRAGGQWLDGYAGAFRGVLRLEGADAKRAADLLDAGARSAGAHLTGRFTASDGPLGWGAWAQRLFYKVNGFEFVAEGHRQGVAAILAAHMGEQAQYAYGRLNAGFRETLERFGIDEKAWELVRRGAAKADDGRTYLTFEHLDEITDREAWRHAGLEGKAQTREAADRVRADLETRFRAMVTNILDDSLTEPRARERAGLTRGAKPGTVLGEAIRLFTQFWSFPQAVIGRHMAPAMRGYAGRSPAALMAQLVLATTLGGYMSLQAKQIVKGRAPRRFTDDEGHLDGGLFVASMLQGGGLGIYGDFLFGEANRNGLGFSVGSLAGPAVSELEAAAQIVRAAISGDTEDLPADIVRLGVRNAPFVNLWYTRLALDYTILWRLQEALSPGYLERYQRRVEDQENTRFLVEPTSAAH